MSESGFAGFDELVFDLQALVRIRIGGGFGYGERGGLGESEILKILIPTKGAAWGAVLWIPAFAGMTWV